METTDRPEREVSVNEADREKATRLISESVRELGVRFEGLDRGTTLIFKRARFDPTQNVPTEELSVAIFKTLFWLAEQDDAVKQVVDKMQGIAIS